MPVVNCGNCNESTHYMLAFYLFDLKVNKEYDGRDDKLWRGKGI